MTFLFRTDCNVSPELINARLVSLVSDVKIHCKTDTHVSCDFCNSESGCRL